MVDRGVDLRCFCLTKIFENVQYSIVSYIILSENLESAIIHGVSLYRGFPIEGGFSLLLASLNRRQNFSNVLHTSWYCL